MLLTVHTVHGIALMLVSLQQASSKNVQVRALLLVEPTMVSVHTL